ncbi:MAG: hypothetical protein ACI8P9_001039 [Parasphingorhabdus sp.]|jgi:hypothetical protein
MSVSKITSITGILLGGMMSLNSFATDSYFVCTSINDDFTLDQENGIDLYYRQVRQNFHVDSVLELKTAQGFCHTKAGQAFDWMLSTNVYEISTLIKDEDIEITFLCENFQSAVPAGSNCTNIVLLEKELQGDPVELQPVSEEAILYPDIQTSYAENKSDCQGDFANLVYINRKSIIGPGFSCSIEGLSPAGTGMVGVDAVCSVNGKLHQGKGGLDLGNYADHFELSIPGKEAWQPLYPCSKVDGLL